jgi:hypothetical protein
MIFFAFSVQYGLLTADMTTVIRTASMTGGSYPSGLSTTSSVVGLVDAVVLPEPSPCMSISLAIWGLIIFFSFFCSIWFINCRYENSYINSVHDWRLVSLGPLDHLSSGGVGGRCGLAGALTVHVHQLNLNLYSISP